MLWFSPRGGKFLKVKLPIDLLIIDILSVLLILSIIFIPATVARVILGLPFLLFFPGYVLVAALFPRGEIDGIERVALSFGMSIAVTALIGLGLNYTYGASGWNRCFTQFSPSSLFYRQ